MKYLLIDGNNVAIRSAFANENMRSEKGDPTGAHFGFFNSLLNIKEKYPDYQYLVAWDSSSARRRQESQQGQSQNLIPETYKENRKRGEKRQPLLDWFDQGDYLKRALGTTGIPQIKVNEYEADDVIATYAKQFSREGHEVVMATSDKDFYQLLDDNIRIWDGLKDREFTKTDINSKYGLTPDQLVHVGALMGDKGDNIFGIPGWGETFAVRAIKEHGTWQEVIKNLEDKYSQHREDYPDVSEKAIFDKYQKLATKKGTIKYPQIYFGQPYSGLMVAVENEYIRMPKRDLMALMFKDRVALAYSLKKMDDNIDNLPEVCDSEKNKEKLLEYFEYYDIRSITDRVDILFE
jgi:DNA polymerase-1